MSPELDLTALKPGDPVGIRTRGYSRYDTGTVYRLTTTQIIIAENGRSAPSHRKFRRKDGGEVDVGYGAQLVHPDDPGLLNCIARTLFDAVVSQAEKAWREMREPRTLAGPVQVWETLQLLKAEITAAQEKVDGLIARMPKPERPE